MMWICPNDRKNSANGKQGAGGEERGNHRQIRQRQKVNATIFKTDLSGGGPKSFSVSVRGDTLVRWTYIWPVSFRVLLRRGRTLGIAWVPAPETFMLNVAVHEPWWERTSFGRWPWCSSSISVVKPVNTDEGPIPALAQEDQWSKGSALVYHHMSLLVLARI